MSNYDRESEKLARLVQLLKDKINKSRKKLHGLGYSRHETEQHIERIAARAVKTDLSKHSLVKILKANRSQKVLTQLI